MQPLANMYVCVKETLTGQDTEHSVYPVLPLLSHLPLFSMWMVFLFECLCGGICKNHCFLAIFNACLCHLQTNWGSRIQQVLKKKKSTVRIPYLIVLLLISFLQITYPHSIDWYWEKKASASLVSLMWAVQLPHCSKDLISYRPYCWCKIWELDPKWVPHVPQIPSNFAIGAIHKKSSL